MSKIKSGGDTFGVTFHLWTTTSYSQSKSGGQSAPSSSLTTQVQANLASQSVKYITAHLRTG